MSRLASSMTSSKLRQIGLERVRSGVSMGRCEKELPLVFLIDLQGWQEFVFSSRVPPPPPLSSSSSCTLPPQEMFFVSISFFDDDVSCCLEKPGENSWRLPKEAETGQQSQFSLALGLAHQSSSTHTHS